MVTRCGHNACVLNGFSIECDTADTTLLVLWVLDGNVESGISQHTTNLIFFECLRDAGVYLETVECRLNAQNELSDGVPVPCGSTRQPRVLTLARTGGILASHHLTIDIGLHLVQLLVFYPCRTDFGIVIPSVVATMGYRLADDDPWVAPATGEPRCPSSRSMAFQAR